MIARRCSPSGHEELKRDSQWPALQQVGVWKLDDIALELANCPDCKSTIARKAER